MVDIDESTKKQLVQEVIDRILYCEGYINDLKNLNKKYKPEKKVKFSTTPGDFKFPLHEVIT